MGFSNRPASHNVLIQRKLRRLQYTEVWPWNERLARLCLGKHSRKNGKHTRTETIGRNLYTRVVLRLFSLSMCFSIKPPVCVQNWLQLVARALRILKLFSFRYSSLDSLITMYRNLSRCIRSDHLATRLKVISIQGIGNYHNGSSYYGYRPRPQQNRKSMEIGRSWTCVCSRHQCIRVRILWNLKIELVEVCGGVVRAYLRVYCCF